MGRHRAGYRGELFRDHKFTGHTFMAFAAEVIAVKFKGSHLIGGEGDFGDLVRPDVATDFKGGTVEAVQAIQGGQFQDHRDSFFQMDFIGTIFKFFGLDLDHLFRGDGGGGSTKELATIITNKR